MSEEQKSVGQAAFWHWTRRLDGLNTVRATVESWQYRSADESDAERDMAEMPGLSRALEGLREASEYAEAKLKELAEFAPKKKGKR